MANYYVMIYYDLILCSLIIYCDIFWLIYYIISLYDICYIARYCILCLLMSTHSVKTEHDPEGIGTHPETYSEQGNMIMDPWLVQAGGVLPLLGRWNLYSTVFWFQFANSAVTWEKMNWYFVNFLQPQWVVWSFWVVWIVWFVWVVRKNVSFWSTCPKGAIIPQSSLPHMIEW